MTDWLGHTTTFGYDNDSNLTSPPCLSGTSTSSADSYDNADALTGTTVTTSGTPTALATLTRNADENIATTSTGPGTTYAYDPLNRITTGSTAGYATTPPARSPGHPRPAGPATDYAYNTDGQLCWTGPSLASCTSPPTGATTYTYNTAGERTASHTQRRRTPPPYGWSQSGQLLCDTAPNTSGYTCANPNSTVTSTYAYNGDGLRTSDTPAGGTDPAVHLECSPDRFPNSS